VKDAINDPEALLDRAQEVTDGDGSESAQTSEGDDEETDATSSESAEGEEKRDLETRGEGATPDAEQVGGDPRKGLFARLKQRLS
jgi:PTS system fructose-specific IIB component